MKPIEIFRPGAHTADNGKSYSFSEADLIAAANAYDAEKFPAPLVIGHPAHDDPAHGWVSDLSSDGNSMIATPDDVNPDFAELVEKKAYRNVSASFYAPNAKANPVPGVHYLRHVGFLGAKQPAVKGLAPINFAEDETDIVTVEFAEVSDYTIAWGLKSAARLFRRMRDKILAEEGVEAADEAIADHEIKDIEDAASRAERAGEQKSETTSFAEATEEASMSAEDKKKFDDDQAALAAERKQLEDDRISFAEQQAAVRHAEDKRFLDALADEGKLAPGAIESTLSFMESLDADEVINFGEADADKKTAHAFFKEMLEKSGEVVNFAEVSDDDGEDHNKQDARAIARDAIDFQESEKAAGRMIDTVAAIAHVTAKK